MKDETDNHVELQKATTVLDPDKDYETTLPTKITDYTRDGVTYKSKEDLSKIAGDTNNIKRADIVYNWYKDQSVGNHFTPVSQTGIEQYSGAYEGATMFKFIDRDEWCVMIDYYGSMQVRYEPYITADLSKPDSIKKAAAGTYGRIGGDVGTHGGMIPITVKEYNTLLDTYNADPSISNYHPLSYVSLDTRAYDDKAEELKKAAQSPDYSEGAKAQMSSIAAQITTKTQAIEAVQNSQNAAQGSKNETQTWSEAFSGMEILLKRADKLLANKLKTLPEDMQAENVYLDEEAVTICTKATEGLKKTVTLKAEADFDSETSKITFSSDKPAIAKVDPKTGVVTAKKAGTAKITATAPGGATAVCTVTVKGVPNKLTPSPKKVTLSLKKKKTAQIKVSIPKGTVCSKFNYKSSSKAVSVAKKSGGNTMKITAKKKGSAKITVTAANNSKAKAVINVKVNK